MSATPSAGALRAAEMIITHNIARQVHEPNAPLYKSVVAQIIHEETQAETAALVDALKGFIRQAKFDAKVQGPRKQTSHLITAGEEALAKHGEGAE